MNSDAQSRTATRDAVKPPADASNGAPNDARLRLLAIGWFTLASVAGLYLTTIWMFGPIEFQTVPNKATERIASADTASLDMPLRQIQQPDDSLQSRIVTLGDLTKEMKVLQGKVAQLRNRNAALTKEVDALNEALMSATGALPDQEPLNPRPVLNGVTTSKFPMPSDGFGDLAFISRSPIPIAEAEVPSRTLFGVELSKAKNVMTLKAAWKKLGERHAKLLNGLKPRRVGHGTDQWRLVAGPFANAADAARLCARLRAAQTKCAQTVFLGEAL